MVQCGVRVSFNYFVKLSLNIHRTVKLSLNIHRAGVQTFEHLKVKEHLNVEIVHLLGP